LSMNCI
jgi:hypothetical protein